eukprot:TRINITY_DN65302_c0_g1_i1.p1 TRINITY_DN65302_c0_g1~~TRINITY_DN65302_c0_g1_i1.p1  ORF type:complete len:323 (+),score=96.68 TRINITY_DN65302_c0_g1_i1:68-970(+)
MPPGSAPATRGREPLRWWEDLLAGSAAVVGATVVTHPIDVLKVRLQVRQAARGDASARKDAFSLRRFVRLWPELYRAEGLAAFYSGLGAAAGRAATYGGMRIGLCDPLQRAGLGKAGGALAAGVAATVVGNPLEVLKVRRQLGEQVTLAALARGGPSALFRGFHWAALRSSLLTVSQVVPYGAAKRLLCNRAGLADGVAAHTAASAAAGVVTTTVTSPVDVLKTRVMAAAPGAVSGGLISGTLIAPVRDMVRAEGPMAFFRGWLANYVRLGPQTLFIFVFYEQTRRVALALRSAPLGAVH